MDAPRNSSITANTRLRQRSLQRLSRGSRTASRPHQTRMLLSCCLHVGHGVADRKRPHDPIDLNQEAKRRKPPWMGSSRNWRLRSKASLKQSSGTSSDMEQSALQEALVNTWRTSARQQQATLAAATDHNGTADVRQLVVIAGEQKSLACETGREHRNGHCHGAVLW